MRKIYIICLVLIVLSQAAWGDGTHEKPTAPGVILLPDGKEVDFMGIELTANYGSKLGNLKVYAQDAPMKEDYQTDTKIPVKGLNWGGFEIHKTKEDGKVVHILKVEEIKKEGNIYPISNLDIYVYDNGEKIPISKYEVTVTVKMSYEVLKTVNSGQAPSKQILFIFDRDMWIPIDDPRSGIIEIKHFPDHIEFIIVDWPANDRMFCSGP